PQNIWLFCSQGVDPTEQSRSAPEFQGTAFAHFVAAGLAGYADVKANDGKANGDGVVDLAELREYVSTNVLEWSKKQAAQAQSPKLLPDTRDPKRLQLQLAACQPKSGTPAPGWIGADFEAYKTAALERLDRLTDKWTKLNELRSGTGDRRLIPRLSSQDQRLRRLERLAVGGPALEKQFGQELDQLTDISSSKVAEGIRALNPLSLREIPADGQFATEVENWTQFWRHRLNPPATGADSTELKEPKLPETSRAREVALWNLIRDARGNELSDIWSGKAIGDVLKEAPQDPDQLTEPLYLRMLRTWLPAKELDVEGGGDSHRVGWNVVGDLLRRRDRIETLLENPRGQSWLRPQVERADSRRRNAEDWLFLTTRGDSENRAADQLTAELLREEEEVVRLTKLAAVRNTALELSDTAWVEFFETAGRGPRTAEEQSEASRTERGKRVSGLRNLNTRLTEIEGDPQRATDDESLNALDHAIQACTGFAAAYRKTLQEQTGAPVQKNANEAVADTRPIRGEDRRDIESLLRTGRIEASSRRALWSRWFAAQPSEKNAPVGEDSSAEDTPVPGTLSPAEEWVKTEIESGLFKIPDPNPPGEEMLTRAGAALRAELLSRLEAIATNDSDLAPQDNETVAGYRRRLEGIEHRLRLMAARRDLASGVKFMEYWDKLQNRLETTDRIDARLFAIDRILWDFWGDAICVSYLRAGEPSGVDFSARATRALDHVANFRDKFFVSKKLPPFAKDWGQRVQLRDDLKWLKRPDTTRLAILEAERQGSSRHRLDRNAQEEPTLEFRTAGDGGSSHTDLAARLAKFEGSRAMVSTWKDDQPGDRLELADPFAPPSNPTKSALPLPESFIPSADVDLATAFRGHAHRASLEMPKTARQMANFGRRSSIRVELDPRLKPAIMFVLDCSSSMRRADIVAVEGQSGVPDGRLDVASRTLKSLLDLLDDDCKAGLITLGSEYGGKQIAPSVKDGDFKTKVP
ncbi:MAG: hypothetical protein NT069_11650, partial [Planctomycetota bacterium]|nr:hypothetical protein [Planctomycetota bacterium]